MTDTPTPEDEPVQDDTPESPVPIGYTHRDFIADRTGDLLREAVAVAREVPRVQTGAIPDPRDGTIAPIYVTSEGVQPIGPGVFEAYREQPLHAEGTARVTRLESFIDLTERHMNRQTSAMFVVDDDTRPSMTSVIDYHEAKAKPDDVLAPHYGRHRVHYPFPLSREWQAWMGTDGSAMTMTEFAQFLEDRIVDVLEPGAADDLPDAAKDFVKKVGGKVGSPTQLIEISRSLQVHESSNISSATKLGSGETQIVFENTHTDAAGKPVNVPGLFLIAIPVFANAPVAYRMIARFRYRKSGPAISFAYELWRPDLVMRAAIDEAVDHATKATGLPVFYGTPEMGV